MTYKIGDKAQGGIVFCISSDGKHGLVAAEVDQSTKAKWNEAIKICSELELNGFRDWFLPSIDILSLMYTNLHKKDLGGFVKNFYWSSSHDGFHNAWNKTFDYGYQPCITKYGYSHVRAVRAF